MEIIVQINLHNTNYKVDWDPSNPTVLIVTLSRADLDQLVTALRFNTDGALPPGTVVDTVRFSGPATATMRMQCIRNHGHKLLTDPVLRRRHLFAPHIRVQ